LDELHRSFDIVYTSSVDIYGFEFDIIGVNVESYDHNLNGEVYVFDNQVLGISFTQDALFPPAIEGELMSITYAFSLEENTSICLTNGIFGGEPGVQYNSEETCNDVNWFGSGISIAFGEVSTNMADSSRTLEINYESNVDIVGFQMTLDGITLLDVISEYFTITYTANTGVIAGFNISGGILPEGQGTLLIISFAGENIPAGEANLCITAATFASHDGSESIPVDYDFPNGNCLEIDAIWYDCNGDGGGNSMIDNCEICSEGNSGHEADSDQDDCGVCFGSNVVGSVDINADSQLDVNDIVLMVSHVIDDSNTLDSCGLFVGDVNSDSIVNILDIIVVIETIFYGDLARTDEILQAAPSTLELLQRSNSLGYLTDKPGLIGFELILSHAHDFSIELNEESFIGSYNTSGNETKIIVALEGDSELFTTTGKFEIEEMMIGTTMGELLDVSVTIIPDEYTLARAYPNPFNPVTTLSFTLPAQSEVALSIYNLQGREVTTLIDANMDAGYHSVVWNADNFSSGMYFVKMISGGFVNTQKLMLIK